MLKLFQQWKKKEVILETVSSSLYKSALTVLNVVDIEIMHS